MNNELNNKRIEMPNGNHYSEYPIENKEGEVAATTSPGSSNILGRNHESATRVEDTSSTPDVTTEANSETGNREGNLSACEHIPTASTIPEEVSKIGSSGSGQLNHLNTPKSEEPASQLSELLLYHAALGRGYISPFPVTRGLVFSAALPEQALSVLSTAEMSFRRDHEEMLKADKRLLAELEDQPAHMTAVNGMDKNKVKEAKEKISRRSHVTWREEQVLKSTLVELLKTHYYGSFTLVDEVGLRIGGALSHAAKLNSELGLTTIMEGTVEETFIRSSSSGGANIHSLNGVQSTFNYFSYCTQKKLDALKDKIKNTTHGQSGLKRTLLIPGKPGAFSGMTSDVLHSLMKRVFALGEKPVEQRVKVQFTQDSAQGWSEFLGQGLEFLIGDPDPPAWQWKLTENSPVSTENAILFGARASMVRAFIEVARQDPYSPIKLVELTGEHLKWAQNAAKFIYLKSSGQEGIASRIKYLKDSRETFLSDDKLAVAKRAIEEAIRYVEPKRVSRRQVRYDVKGATLGLVDELVRRGEISKIAEGKSRYYTLNKYAPRIDPQEALDEYQEACQDFAEHPDAFTESEAIEMILRIREKAEDVFAEHFLPMVPLSKLSGNERRLLPRILEMMPQSFLLRGDAAETPEPEILRNDEDVPFDEGGLNLWVRYRKDGKPFCDWQQAGKLKLGHLWDDNNKDPGIVPD